MSRFNLWDHFRKIDGENDERKAECLLCENKLNYASTAHNLKSHLVRRHGDVVVVVPPSPTNVSRKPRENNSLVWLLFTRSDGDEKIAVCNVCDKRCSFKTTTTNLKSHFRRSHPDQYKKITSCFERDLEDSDEEIDEVYMKLENLDDDSNQSAAAPDVWSFFEQETGGRARCVVCRATLPHRTRDLRLHLKDNHPKLAQDFDETSENEDEQKDTYTEVVYLEDESRKSIKREQHPRKRSSYQPATIAKKPKKRKSSSSSDEFLRERSADDNDEQLEKFGTYITCLLKKMPKDVCIKLQMDVINLIMTTKLKLQSEAAAESKVIIDGVPVAIQTVSGIPGTGFLVTVPGGECKQAPPGGDAKVDPLVHDGREQPKLLANPLPKDMSYAIVE